MTVADGRVARALRAARADTGRYLAALAECVGFASVSSDPRRTREVRACAEWLAAHLAEAGLEDTRIVPSAGHPVVLASWRHAADAPTVLVYGHYDVQPPGPLGAWRSPPFRATRRGEHLYGRGASDDKGQLLAQVAALRAWLRGTGGLPVNVVCLFEGEEEIGSPSLRSLLLRHREDLRADAAVVSDTRMLGPCRPTLVYALRGSLSVEARVRGPRTDLHSGTFGGAVYNPLQVVADLAAGLHDRCGRVRVPGFYDRVRPVPVKERQALASVAPTDAEVRQAAGVVAGWGEPGFTLFERTTIRPAITLQRISTGQVGEARAAAIPATAALTLNVRLVPEQDTADVGRLLRRHFGRALPRSVELQVLADRGVAPVVVDPEHPAVRAAMAAERLAFGASPVLLRSGGTIAPVSLFVQLLGLPVVLMGFALPDDAPHAPNERAHLPTLARGVEACVRFAAEAARRVAPTAGSARETGAVPAKERRDHNVRLRRW